MANFQPTDVQKIFSSDNLYYADQFKTLQDAVNAVPVTGGKVILSSRVYSLSAPLDLKSNIWIEGTGYGSVIRPSSAWTGGALLRAFYCKNILITSLKVEGSGRAERGIRFSQCSKSSVHDVIISNCTKHGILVDGAVPPAPPCPTDPPEFLPASTEIHIHGNTITGCENGIMCTRGLRNSTISDNTILYTKEAGDAVPAGIKIAVVGVVSSIEYPVPSSDNTITGNTISGFWTGILLEDGHQRNTVGNNTVNNCEFGIYLSSSDPYSSISEDNVVQGNTIANTNDSGIVLYGARSNIVSNNTLSDCGVTNTVPQVYLQQLVATSGTEFSSDHNIVSSNSFRLTDITSTCPSITISNYENPTSGAQINIGNIVTSNVRNGDQPINVDITTNVVANNYPRTADLGSLPDFDSGVFPVDNSGLQNRNQYFLAKQLIHNLNTRDLESQIQLSTEEPLLPEDVEISSDPCAPPPPGGYFRSRVWLFNGSAGGTGIDDISNGFRVVCSDENTIDFYVRAHPTLTDGELSTEQGYLFHDFDPDYEQESGEGNGARGLYIQGVPDYVKRGIAVTKIWCRIILRKTSV